MQRLWLGQDRQSLRENLTLMTSLPCRSVAALQLRLAFLRAGHGLLLPIHAELARGEGAGLACLPARFGRGGTEQVHPKRRAGGGQERALDVAAVDQVDRGQEIVLLQGLVDRVGGGVVREGSRRGLDVGDQVRRVGLAGLGEMDFVTHPLGRPLADVARVGVVRAAHVDRRGWKLIVPPPVDPGLVPIEVLDPDPAQGLDCRDLA